MLLSLENQSLYAVTLLEDEENKEFEKVNFEGEFVFNKS